MRIGRDIVPLRKGKREKHEEGMNFLEVKLGTEYVVSLPQINLDSAMV